MTRQDEQSLRDLRWKWLRQWQNENGYDWVVTGHHQQDLLETRLIRLIRGTGPDGLKAMSFCDGDILRPFLSCSHEELLEYTKNQGFDYVEDPSNENPYYLRNWIRGEWLSQLEEKRSGAVSSLGRSLQIICDALESGRLEREPFNSLNRLFLQQLSKKERLAELSSLSSSVLGKSLSSQQIAEVEKRIDTQRKDLVFQVGGLEWVLSKHLVAAFHLTKH